MMRTDTPSPPASLLRRLFTLLRAERGWMLAGTAIAVLSTLAGIGLIAVSGHFITAMALAGASGAAINYYTPAALIRLLAIVRTLGRYLERLITHEATLRALARLRSWLFTRLTPLAPARLQALRSAALFSRLRADVDALEHAYLGIALPVINALAVMLGTLIVMLIYLPWLAACMAVLIVIAGAYLPWRTSQRGKAPGADIVTCAETLRELAADGLRGRAELLLYGAEAMHAEHVARIATQQQQARRQLDVLQAMGNAGVVFCAQLAVIGTLMLGLPAWHAGGVAAPDLVMLALLAQASFEAVVPLPEAWTQWGALLTSARRIFTLADTPPAIEEPTSTPTLPACLDLSIRQLRLRYGDSAPWALDGVNLDLAHGARLALVGPSGAGKSSLIGALLRFYPFEGRMTLGGLPLEHWHGDELRSCMAVVEQQPYLFDASLRENLKLGRPEATDDELDAVLTQARLQGYVASLPHGLDTWVGENGVRVSGGEARRIAMARALLMDAPILILDEPTEGLDAVTANEIYDSLATAAHKRSLLVITHRLGKLSTLVDEVAIMREGRVIERMSVEAYRLRMAPEGKETMREPSSSALS